MDIYVDLDGTLTLETEGHNYIARTPRTKTIEKINKLYNSGNVITIWTARWEEDKEITLRWLRKHGVLFNRLILGKPTFDLYICDKVMHVENL